MRTHAELSKYSLGMTCAAAREQAIRRCAAGDSILLLLLWCVDFAWDLFFLLLLLLRHSTLLCDHGLLLLRGRCLRLLLLLLLRCFSSLLLIVILFFGRGWTVGVIAVVFFFQIGAARFSAELLAWCGLGWRRTECILRIRRKYTHQILNIHVK